MIQTAPQKHELDKFGEYVVIPIGDREKVKSSPGLQNYWLDCWEADPFGTHWVKLSDNPSSTTEAKYRKRLEELGLFLFEKRGRMGNWTIWCLNLHGSRAHLGRKCIQRHISSYGMPNVPEETVIWLESLLDIKTTPSDNTEPKSARTAPILDTIEKKNAETLASQELENLSISPQKLLIEVTEEEEKENQAANLRLDSPKEEENGIKPSTNLVEATSAHDESKLLYPEVQNLGSGLKPAITIMMNIFTNRGKGSEASEPEKVKAMFQKYERWNIDETRIERYLKLSGEELQEFWKRFEFEFRQRQSWRSVASVFDSLLPGDKPVRDKQLWEEEQRAIAQRWLDESRTNENQTET